MAKLVSAAAAAAATAAAAAAAAAATGEEAPVSNKQDTVTARRRPLRGQDRGQREG